MQHIKLLVESSGSDFFGIVAICFSSVKLNTQFNFLDCRRPISCYKFQVSSTIKLQTVRIQNYERRSLLHTFSWSDHISPSPHDPKYMILFCIRKLLPPPPDKYLMRYGH